MAANAVTGALMDSTNYPLAVSTTLAQRCGYGSFPVCVCHFVSESCEQIELALPRNFDTEARSEVVGRPDGLDFISNHCGAYVLENADMAVCVDLSSWLDNAMGPVSGAISTMTRPLSYTPLTFLSELTNVYPAFTAMV